MCYVLLLLCIGYDVIESLRIQGKQGKQRSLTIFKINNFLTTIFLSIFLTKTNTTTIITTTTTDRLPSGKEVDILYLEDMHLKPVHKSKQRGKAHNTRDKTAAAAAGSTAGKATTSTTTASTVSSATASTKSGRPPLPVTATVVAAVGQPKKRK